MKFDKLTKSAKVLSNFSALIQRCNLNKAKIIPQICVIILSKYVVDPLVDLQH